ncbi:MAG TPA: DJ-1/PfpI family protein [Spirochaetota bacterium]|nr:DJ-1/PfpI family protein [Spirochaetota bacterium]
MKILVPLAEGFEEIEAITIIDVLRRADIGVVTAFLDKNPVTGSHGIPITADRKISDVRAADFGAMVLPGGMPGSEHLKNSAAVIGLLGEIQAAGGLVGAICAAPMVLGHAGLLAGKKATCFPGMDTELKGAVHVDAPVVVDGRIVTGKGPACAIPFALEIVGILGGGNLKDALRTNLQVYWKM